MNNITDEALKQLYLHILENSGSASGMDLTIEEYNALSEEEKMNGTIYFVHGSEESSEMTALNPYVIEISKEAYDALPENDKNCGKLFFVKDTTEYLSATDIFSTMNPKGEIQSSALPSSAANNDFYYLLDKHMGVIRQNGVWKYVK